MLNPEAWKLFFGWMYMKDLMLILSRGNHFYLAAQRSLIGLAVLDVQRKNKVRKVISWHPKEWDWQDLVETDVRSWKAGNVMRLFCWQMVFITSLYHFQSNDATFTLCWRCPLILCVRLSSCRVVSERDDLWTALPQAVVCTWTQQLIWPLALLCTFSLSWCSFHRDVTVCQCSGPPVLLVCLTHLPSCCLHLFCETDSS